MTFCKTFVLILSLSMVTDCKSKKGMGSTQGISEGTASDSFSIVFGEYDFDGANFQKVNDVTVQLPSLDTTPPTAALLPSLNLSDGMKAGILDVQAQIITLTGKGLSWDITQTTPTPFKAEGCHNFALVSEDTNPILIVDDQSEDISDVILRLDPSFSIFSAGEICVNTDGQIIEVNNKSELGSSQDSNSNFMELFYQDTDTSGLNLNGVVSFFSGNQKNNGSNNNKNPAPAAPPAPAPVVGFASGNRVNPAFDSERKLVQELDQLPNSMKYLTQEERAERDKMVVAQINAEQTKLGRELNINEQRNIVDNVDREVRAKIFNRPNGATPPPVKLSTRSSRLLEVNANKIDKVPGFTENIPSGTRRYYSELGYSTTIPYLGMIKNLSVGLDGKTLPRAKGENLKIEGLGEIRFLTAAQSRVYVMTLDNNEHSEFIMKEFRQDDHTFAGADHEAYMMRQFIDRDDFVHYYGAINGVKLDNLDAKGEGLESRFILMKKMDGDMVNFFETEKFTPLQANKATLQVIGSVKAGHDRNIVFADLKLNNFLYSKNFKGNANYLENELYTVVMSDLGAATKQQTFGADQLSVIGAGTDKYLAPERAMVTSTLVSLRNTKNADGTPLIDTSSAYRQKIADGKVDLAAGFQSFQSKSFTSVNSFNTIQTLKALPPADLTTRLKAVAALDPSKGGLSNEQKILKEYIDMTFQDARNAQESKLVQAEVEKYAGLNYDVRASDISSLGHVIYGIKFGKILFDEFDPPPSKCVACFDSKGIPDYSKINPFLDGKIAAQEKYVQSLSGQDDQKNLLVDNMQQLETLKLVKRTFEPPSTRPNIDQVETSFTDISNMTLEEAQKKRNAIQP